MSELRGARASVAARPVAVGEGLAERRVIAYSLGLVALYAGVLGGSALRGIWFVDVAGHGIATDFLAFWGAGRLALEGAAPLAYDIERLKLVQELGLGRAYAGTFPWFYPPFFLLVAAPFALLSYVPALFLWVGATLAAYLAAIRAILPRGAAVVAALAAPTVCGNVVTGQNGLLTAALLGGGLVLLEPRPWLAGALLGLLAYKPQFALLIPLALIGAGRWRALAAAAATVAVAVGVSTALFGWDAWTAFLAAQGVAADRVLMNGGIGMFKIQSVYAALRLLGAANGLAWLGQGIVAAVTAFGVLWLWRRPVSFSLKAAALATAVLIVTPYLLIYDLTVLTVALAFLVEDGISAGFLLREKPALAGIFLLPLLFVFVQVPLGPLASGALLALILRRVFQARAARSDPRLTSRAPLR